MIRPRKGITNTALLAFPSKKHPPRKPYKRMNKVSKKRRGEMRIYSKLRVEFLERNPICQFKGCADKSVHVHHKRRRGRNYLNVETWMAICAGHHEFIHLNPKWSKENGLLSFS